jgi:ABC-type uncharacterized transport system substrate-binding protein
LRQCLKKTRLAAEIPPRGIKTILVPVTFDTPAPKLNLEDLRQAAELKGINLIIPELSSPEDMPKAFEENRQKVDAVFMVHSIFIIKKLIRHD